MERARLITFEGIDGSGKTALSKLLFERMQDVHHAVSYVEEFCEEYLDGYIQNGLKRDPYLKLKPELYSSWGQTLLFASSYTYKYETRIEPRLKRDELLLVDRFRDTVFAFHSVLFEEWDGLSREEAEAWISQILKPLPQPDLTFFMSAKIEDLQVRWTRRGTAYSDDYQEYLGRVEARYESQLAQYPERVVTLDASLSLKENLEICESHVQKLLIPR